MKYSSAISLIFFLLILPMVFAGSFYHANTAYSQYCHTCSPKISYTAYTTWTNISCLPDGTMNQTRSRIKYDANNCGLISNETLREYRHTLRCNYCAVNMTTVPTTEWTNISCMSNDFMNQSRTYLTYDKNSCGNTTNTSFTNYRTTETCDYCTPNIVTMGSPWINLECLPDNTMNQSSTIITYDSNYCGEVPIITRREYRHYEYCDYCVPYMTYTTYTDWTNLSCLQSNTMDQVRSRVRYDLHNCGEVFNETLTEHRNTEYCDFCTPNMTTVPTTEWTNISCLSNNMMNQSITYLTYDQNGCNENPSYNSVEYRAEIPCDNVTITCNSDSDCGEDFDTLSCNGLDIMLTRITPTCMLPSTKDSYCMNTTDIWAMDTCDHICSDTLGCDYTQCSDSDDNDLDGQTDFPADLGCSNYSDDDESDGKINCTMDSDCGSVQAAKVCDNLNLNEVTFIPVCRNSGTEYSYCDNVEDTYLISNCSNICSSDLGCDYTQCSDIFDNDNDATIDFPQDLGCDSYYDNNESDGIINCSANEDCGTVDTSSMCMEYSFITTKTVPTCNKAGTEQSYCSNETSSEFETCKNICSSEFGCDYTQCSDMIDNDNDSRIDYNQDPGCDSFYDDNETDTTTVITCSVDSDCGIIQNSSTCEGLSFITTQTAPVCNKAGTENSYCSNQTSVDHQLCNNLCSAELGCDYCTPNMTSTEWNDWTSIECSLDQMNQTRSRVNYDQNNCGVFGNTTETEYRPIGPEFQNGTWSNWNDITECMPGDYYTQERNLTQNDIYGCAQSIVLNDYQNQTCDYCTPDMAFTEWNDWNNVSCLPDNTMNQSRSRELYDANYCAEIDNETFTEYRNTEYCDFCTPDLVYSEWSSWENLSCVTGNIINQSRSRTLYDSNNCGETQDSIETEYRTDGICSRQCSDNIDNDFDGYIDYPNDLGCDSQDDDNESDGPVTCAIDSDCGTSASTRTCDGLSLLTETSNPKCNNAGTEHSYCSNETSLTNEQCNNICSGDFGCDYTQCSDMIDNDNDLTIDFHQDLGCDSYYDNNESDGSVACTVNSDCGQFETVSNCEGLVIMLTTTTPICNNAGTESSYCSNQTSTISDACDNLCSAELGCDYTQCSDTIDNDFDGLIDYGQDLGCDSFYDNNETDTTTVITCSVDSDCGTSNTTQSCNEANDLVTSISTPSCINPGTASSYCSTVFSASLQNCISICSAVYGCDYVGLTANMIAYPESGLAPLNISFSVNATGSGVLSYSWDFDNSDGIQVQSTSINPMVLYNLPGNYTVTLTVKSDGGLTGTVTLTKIITVLPQYQNAFSPAVELLDPDMLIEHVYITNDGRLNAGQFADFAFKFRNRGATNLGNVRITVAIPELGISRTSQKVILDRKDTEIKHLSLFIPSDTVPGEYTARVVVFDSTAVKRVEHRPIWIS